MERQKATTEIKNMDAFSEALIRSVVYHLGEEGIPSLQKKGDENNFAKKDPKEKASAADPAINIAGGTGVKQSHGAEIKHTNVVAKDVQKEEAELEEAKNKEGKEQGADGKACWDGYKYAGTKNGKDKCVKSEEWEGSKEDKKEDEKLAKKNKMSLKDWEKSDADKKHDMKKEEVEKKEKEKDEGGKHKEYKHAPGKEEKGEKKTEKEMKEQVTLRDIVEKAVSKSQQRFMGMVHAKKKGDMEGGSKEVKQAAASMTDKEATKFASTKHKGLPEKKTKKEDYDVDAANQLWSEVGERLEKLGEMDNAKFKVIGEKMDPVGKEDSDVNNDGKVDKQDKFLKGRRSKISKIIAAKKKVDEMIALEQEIIAEKK
jgi:hypothetical protein